MMRARLLIPTAVAISLFAASTAIAAPLPPLSNEATPLPIGVPTLPTGLLGLGDTDPTSLVVTDSDLASAGILSTPQVLVSNPAMLIVDDDHLQCPNATFTSINAAVLAATPGATIRVCPGLYKESVLIPPAKPGLFLQAPRHQGEATECKTSTAPDPTQEAIVVYNNSLNGGNPSEGFDIEASNVVIEGFVVQPDATFVTHDGVGIFASRFISGWEVRHNVVQRNTIGMYLNSNGASPSAVRQNCFRDNNFVGSVGGTGFYSDQGLEHVRIEDNFFTQHQNAAIIIDTFLTTPSDVQITHNETVNDGAIDVFDSANMTVSYNKVTNSSGSGIVLYAVNGGEVSYNNLQGGAFNGISFHFATNIAVKSNQTLGFGLTGVRIADDSNNNTIETSRSWNNGEVGMQLTSNSINNIVRNNHMKNNVLDDCYDDTAGPYNPPAFVANQWINDLGQTENRPGLCKHASP